MSTREKIEHRGEKLVHVADRMEKISTPNGEINSGYVAEKVYYSESRGCTVTIDKSTGNIKKH